MDRQYGVERDAEDAATYGRVGAQFGEVIAKALFVEDQEAAGVLGKLIGGVAGIGMRTAYKSYKNCKSNQVRENVRYARPATTQVTVRTCTQRSLPQRSPAASYQHQQNSVPSWESTSVASYYQKPPKPTRPPPPVSCHQKPPKPKPTRPPPPTAAAVSHYNPSLYPPPLYTGAAMPPPVTQLNPLLSYPPPLAPSCPQPAIPLAPSNSQLAIPPPLAPSCPQPTIPPPLASSNPQPAIPPQLNLSDTQLVFPFPFPPSTTDLALPPLPVPSNQELAFPPSVSATNSVGWTLQ